ncbi:MAG: hypothetical protein HY363_02350 [Candidatus Aenigmarchaeota archaeon]|nr:hypothetical protein [Candidatus Aenigmarchaeota archaeon]
MNRWIELVVLLFFSSALLWVGIGDIWSHRISHDFPYAYLATDTFQHQTRAQWIKDAGNYQYEAPYYSAGFKDVVGFYPPLFNHLAVILSHLSGQEVYDVIILLPVLAAITAILLLYYLIRPISSAYAVLCLPFASYIFYIKETLVAFFWGHWPAVVGDLFLFSTCIAITQWNKKNMWAVIGILLLGTVYTHTASFIFATLFLLFWLAYTRFIDTARHPAKIDVAKSLIVLGAGSAYFLNLFRQSWMIIHPFKLAPVTEWLGGGGYLQFTHFGIVQYLVFTGIAAGLFLAKKHTPLLISLFFLAAGLMNYVGFTIRSFNLRFFWPITLAPFFALPLYLALKQITKKFLVAVVIATILFALITQANYKRAIDQEGFMNKYIWENLMWLRANTPENSTVYFGYGDLYDQDAGLGNAQRTFARTETEDLIPYYQQQNITRYLPIKLFAEAGAGLPHKTAPLKYSLYLKENTSTGNNHLIRDLCAYDYYVFDRISQYPEIIKYSLKYPELMMLSGNFEIAHANNWSVILHNKKPGDDCIEQK